MLCIACLTDALEKVGVIVETLLTVALVARQRVLTVALLADFISKQSALVDVCRGGRNNQISVAANEGAAVNYGKRWFNQTHE